MGPGHGIQFGIRAHERGLGASEAAHGGSSSPRSSSGSRSCDFSLQAITIPAVRVVMLVIRDGRGRGNRSGRDSGSDTLNPKP